jgi:hypothetical protein
LIDRLYPLVVADPGERPPQHREVAGVDGHVVDPDRVERDPQNQQHASRGPVHAGADRHAERHLERGNGDHERDEQTGGGRPVGFPLETADQPEQRQQGKRGEQR